MTRLRLVVFLLVFGSYPAAFEGKKPHLPGGDVDEIEATLTKKICRDVLNERPDSPLVERCCEAHYQLGMVESKCQAELTHTDDRRLAVHNFANCVFIKKKYTKGNESLNFKRIIADFDRLEDPRERRVMLELYKDCNDIAKRDLKEIKARTKPGDLPLGVRRPFYMMVFMCITTYTKRVACPYFLWQKDVCFKYISKCQTLFSDNEL